MIKFENVEVMGWEAAIREIHNAMGSCEESDSEHKYESWHDISGGYFEIGPNDLDLIMHLRDSVADYCKFMRTITVYVDITAPLYWWKEFGAYTVETAENSCSIMSKIADKEFTLEDFSCEHLMSFYNSNYWEEDSDNACFIDPGKTEVIVPRSLMLNYIIPMLNVARDKYNEMDQKLKKSDLVETEKLRAMAQRKRFLWQIIQLIPSSYNKKRTVMLNYEILMNLYESYQNNKFDEWDTFCDWIEELPYGELIIKKENIYAKN